MKDAGFLSCLQKMLNDALNQSERLTFLYSTSGGLAIKQGTREQKAQVASLLRRYFRSKQEEDNLVIEAFKKSLTSWGLNAIQRCHARDITVYVCKDVRLDSAADWHSLRRAPARLRQPLATAPDGAVRSNGQPKLRAGSSALKRGGPKAPKARVSKAKAGGKASLKPTAKKTGSTVKFHPPLFAAAPPPNGASTDGITTDMQSGWHFAPSLAPGSALLSIAPGVSLSHDGYGTSMGDTASLPQSPVQRRNEPTAPGAPRRDASHRVDMAEDGLLHGHRLPDPGYPPQPAHVQHKYGLAATTGSAYLSTQLTSSVPGLPYDPVPCGFTSLGSFRCWQGGEVHPGLCIIGHGDAGEGLCLGVPYSTGSGGSFPYAASQSASNALPVGRTYSNGLAGSTASSFTLEGLSTVGTTQAGAAMQAVRAAIVSSNLSTPLALRLDTAELEPVPLCMPLVQHASPGTPGAGALLIDFAGHHSEAQRRDRVDSFMEDIEMMAAMAFKAEEGPVAASFVSAAGPSLVR